MRKLIGDKTFYKMTLTIAIPVMIQNGITNFVGVLDNVMVGRIGTESMSGVAIANQLLFIFNLLIFGAVSGAGIFTAQFYGAGNTKGVRDTFRFKMIICTLLTALAIGALTFKGRFLIGLYLTDGTTGDVAATLEFGWKYMLVMFIGLLPFALTQAYASTLRETGETRLPMIAGVTAVLVNLFFNWVLIYGMLGAPRLGVIGAAIATVLSRVVELVIMVAATGAKANKFTFIKGAYSSLKVPLNTVKMILIKGTPLTLNEVMWAVSVSVMLQCYSTRGLPVVAALNITSTVGNLFKVVFFAMGNAIAIIVGQQLGANKLEEAKTSATRLMFFGVVLSIGVGGVMAATSPFIPMLYRTEPYVRSLATSLLVCAAMCMPMEALSHTAYFTLRSGGKTLVTFLFDSFYMWVVPVPLAFVLSRFTSLPIVPLYLICEMNNIVKCIIGCFAVKKGIWINNMVGEDNNAEVESAISVK